VYALIILALTVLGKEGFLSTRKRYEHINKIERDRMKRYEYRPRPYTSGNKVSHTTVVSRKNESPDRTIKRFLKKCKKDGIAEKVREKMYFEKPSTTRRKKNIRKKRMLDKLKLEQENK